MTTHIIPGNHIPGDGPEALTTGCTVDDCQRPRHARAMCSLHYGRWFRHGDPRVNFRGPDVQIEDVEWMAETGESLEGAAARLGVKPDTLETRLQRMGKAELATVLRRRNPRAMSA